MAFLNTAIRLFGTALQIGGAFIAVFGIVRVAMGLSDSRNQNQMTEGFFTALGGAIIFAAATWMNTIDASALFGG
ncbi:MAG: hypothetical protein KBT48_09295 [Firmicutes bacterium]|nr:hypothetical protein [Bacillota bacterium]